MTVDFEQLLARARALVGGGRRALLGITGAPAAGKSTLAEALVSALAPAPPPGADAHRWVAHVPMDGFHLADVELDRLHRRDRKGAPDTFDASGFTALLRRLRDDTADTVYAPAFERTLEQPIAGAIPVGPGVRLVVTEGNYLLHDDDGWAGVRALLDEVWYVELDPQERLRRLVARHRRFGKDERASVAWATGTDERNAAVVAVTRPHADLLVSAAVLDGLRPPG